MDNVMNRPLFRRREARDRLNEMAGVQGYQVGGPVFEGGGREPVRPAGLPTLMDRLRSSGAMAFPTLMPLAAASMAPDVAESQVSSIMQGLNEKIQDPNLSPNERQALEDQRSALSTAIQAGYGTLDALTDAAALLQRLGTRTIESVVAPAVSVVSPTAGEMLYEQIPAWDVTADELALMGQEVPESMRPSNVLPERPLEAAIRSAGPQFERTGRQRPLASTIPAPAGIGGARPEAVAAGMPAAPEAAPETAAPTVAPSFERTGRGAGPLITNPAEVAAGLNAPDPAVREKTAADFMQEFMANAPKYEGADKNLMHAMIGFSIAAGDSPNAMTNIARGLQAGAQMFLQDKAAKDEFDRQLQLSAMQYGLQEVGKERERGRQPLTFVALEDTTYKGRPVKRGEQVYIPYREIERNGGVAPAGFGDTAMATAMADREKGYRELLTKAYEDKLVDDTFVATQRDAYSAATSNAIAAQRGIDYMEAAILKVGEENDITGIQGGANDFVSKVAAAAGLDDIATEFGDRGQAVSLVQKAFQNLIPAALSGVQTANSISNRDIELLANAYVDSMMDGGVFSMSTITEEKLMNSMKGALDLLQSSRQRSLTDLAGIERTLSGRYLRSGDLTAPVSAATVLEPYRTLIPGSGDVGVPSTFGTLYRSDDGVYDIMRPGG
ncbi:hypothetical protein UFOVP330_34 [uncultured Caudovirales phage]|uniref:Uncharacterized protein n=1 Tax=uncultured Caudovirales phage TaxID=2100421 RepID=A0A6J5LWE1_9CAUD|nr:hypothetical protein UFOVP330_34 [uncultured Caudovirales phage]